MSKHSEKKMTPNDTAKWQRLQAEAKSAHAQATHETHRLALQTLIAACALVCSTIAAHADVVTLTYSGTIAPAIIGPSYSTVYGYDFGGYFGPAGASIAGDPFTVTWTGIDCNCAGTASFNPVIDAVLTINGHSFDLGAGGPGLSAYNDFYDNLHQVEIGTLQTQNGGLSYLPLIQGSMTTEYAGYGNQPYGTPGHDGVFYLHLSDDSSQWTQAFLTIDAVPAPVIGAGLPGLLAALLAMLAALFRKPWKIRGLRKFACEIK
jgi:hypothetical protein